MRLRHLVDRLAADGRLARVRRPVSTELEIAAVARKLAGRPVIFERVVGHDLPVVSNLCATRDLVALALGVPRRELLARLAAAVDHPVTPTVTPARGYVERPADLGALPILRHFPEEGGPYICAGVAVAHDPQLGTNLSYHRAMVVGRDRLALRILERHLHALLARGLRRFFFAVGNPAPVLVAAALSVELGRSELGIAAALGPTEVVEVDGQPVPAAELLLDCELDGGQVPEGPFLDLTGTFDVVRPAPTVRVRRVLAREDAVYHALLPGDLEHKVLMGMPREPTILREVGRECEALDVNVDPGGCSWLHAVVKIRKRGDDDGRRAIAAAFRGHASLKHVWIVDEDIDIEDPLDVEWAMATRFQGHRDMVVLEGEKGSSLDPSSDLRSRTTTKIGFDCTAPLGGGGKGFGRPRAPLDVDLADYLAEPK